MLEFAHRRLLLSAALIALTGLLAFGSALRFDFVYDDRWTIVENQWLDAPLGKLMAETARGTAQADGMPDATRPSMIASLWLDRRLFGGAPRGYHIHSLLLYALSAGAATFAAFAIARDELVAVLAGLAFALSPVHAEAVAAVNYREELIAGLGVLVPLAWLFWPEIERSTGTVLAVAGCLSWGLLGKESGLAIVPVFLALVLVLRVDRDFWRSRELPLFALASVLILWLNWRLALTISGDGIPRAPGEPVATRIYDSCRFTARAVWTALLPFTTSPEYPASAPASPLWLMVPVALFGTVLLLARRPGTRTVAAGLSIAALAPIVASPLFGPVNPWADRYVFVGVLGGSLVWAEAGSRLRRWLPRPARVPLLVVACASAGIACFGAARAWATERSVWTAALDHAPDSPRAWAAMSRVERLDGHLDAANHDVARALALDPFYAPARVTRTYNLLARGNLVDARKEIERLELLGGEHPGLERARQCAARDAADARRCIRGRR